ncbi:hypothetical protein LOK49_LG03G03195 [Camellia lanceoleosa]|uniref:Uncharacterized protein n=1 Tax=Camellia lanceoleosa TaxID=1840588 RepID=A0ACC0IAG0_9ERIC|nr:hypothetical protein LOK49_LG03G03195 [Camellia lanceoleosa]
MEERFRCVFQKLHGCSIVDSPLFINSPSVVDPILDKAESQSFMLAQPYPYCGPRATTKRKDGSIMEIKGPESIADHMYRMALMALIAGDLPGVNRKG